MCWRRNVQRKALGPTLRSSRPPHQPNAIVRRRLGKSLGSNREAHVPFVECPHHGGNIAPLLCEHLARVVYDRGVQMEVYKVEAWYLGEAAWCHHYCAQCAVANSLDGTTTIMRDDESLDRLFAMNGYVVPVCPKCFAEWRSNSA